MCLMTQLACNGFVAQSLVKQWNTFSMGFKSDFLVGYLIVVLIHVAWHPSLHDCFEMGRRPGQAHCYLCPLTVNKCLNFVSINRAKYCPHIFS